MSSPHASRTTSPRSTASWSRSTCCSARRAPRRPATSRSGPRRRSGSRAQRRHRPRGAYAQLVTLTRRAVLMEAQVDNLDGKRRALARHRDAVAAVATALGAMDLDRSRSSPAGRRRRRRSRRGARSPTRCRRRCRASSSTPRRTCAARSRARCTTGRPSPSRTSRSRRRSWSGCWTGTEMAARRAAAPRPDGPADARGDEELHLRRPAHGPRRPGARAHAPARRPGPRAAGARPGRVRLDGRRPTTRRRTSRAGLFRVLDEALGAYLSLSPERVTLRLDWTEELEARLTAERTVVLPAGHGEALPDVRPATSRTRSSR